MKILLIANSNIVFGNELQQALKQKGFDTYLLDFESLKVIYQGKVDKRLSHQFDKYRALPKVHMLFRVYLIARFLNHMKFDLVNIHYSRWIYLLIVKSLTYSKLIITFYGSDFYRTTNFIKKIQTSLYKKADAITFTNPLTRQSFLKHYQNFEEKSFVCRFGLKTLDYIDKNRDKPVSQMREYLGYAEDKIIVSCGYNATSAQQHKKIIENLLDIDKELLKQVQFVFPMTYGDMSYKEEIKSTLNQSALNYIVLEEFLYEDANAYVKLASDIMINVLTTDSFSGSMQEFLYAGNSVITGSWLPYELFDKEGVIYAKIDSLDDLNNVLISNIQQVKKKNDLINNREVIYKLSSWKNNIDSWVKMYETV